MIAEKYRDALVRVRKDTETQRLKDIKSLRVSRPGPINRFFQYLARRQWFD